MDPGGGGQLQPLHQQVSVGSSDSPETGVKFRSQADVFFVHFPSRYEVDDIDEEGKE